MTEHTEGKLDYVGDIAVGLYADCDCEPIEHPDCSSNCTDIHTYRPHEDGHEIVAV